MLPRRRACMALATLAACLAPAGTAHAAEPKLTVSRAKLAAALTCTEGVDHATRTPLMLVTGTGVGGDEAYAIARPALDAYGTPACYVNFPHHATADVQVSVQYLVSGLREMSRRAGRKVAVFGISQGGLLPRIALTYWPSLQGKVSDVVAAAGTQHGTTAGDIAECRRSHEGCIPAGFQQAAGSHFLKALNARRDETPGRTAWTTVRSTADETVRPQTGKHPTSALAGASNIVIQKVCPARTTSHFGTAVDSVTFAAIADAIEHRGPAKASRFPADVCAHPYAPGLDEAATSAFLNAGSSLATSRYDSEPRVKREPRVRSWVKR